MKIVARWVLLITFVGLGLLYLNSAAASAWVSGGPPNEYPHAWAQRSLIHFCYSVALIASGIMAFVALGKSFSFSASKMEYVWLIILLVSLAYPHLREFALVDKCLDSGGAWDKPHFECRY